ncbi:MAG: c-type cytochrome biogenesis protein CcmI [Rhodoferax sp.]
MTLFIALALVLTLVALAWMLVPLLRPHAPEADPDATALNAAIYREQLGQIEQEHRTGMLSAEELQDARLELERRLIDDTRAPAAAAPATAAARTAPARAALWALAGAIPLGAVATYLWLGSPASIDPQATQGARQEQIESMVASLAAKLEAKPDNPQGWTMLARSYKVMGRYAQAAQAYERGMALVQKDADMLVEYADVLALSQNHDLQGKPSELLRQALALQPGHAMGLLMSGVAAYQRQDFPAAIQAWEQLLTQLEPDSPDAQQVQEHIAQARNALAGKSGTSSPSAAPTTKKP